MSRQLWVAKVRFRRKKDGPWEDGVSVGTGLSEVDAILDKDAKPLTETPWDWNTLSEEGAMLITIHPDRKPRTVILAGRRVL